MMNMKEMLGEANVAKGKWWNATWNPWIGCTRMSPGCDNCYAGREEDTRFRHLGRCCTATEHEMTRPRRSRPQPPPKGKPYFFRGPVYQSDAKLLDPLRWRKGRRVFVCSRSDLFHEAITFEQIDLAFAVMALCPQHTFQVLTKRPKRMVEYLDDPIRRSFLVFGAAKGLGTFPITPGVGMPDMETMPPWPLANVWIGVTAEDQKRWDERREAFLACPAVMRFVSVEPMLGPVDLRLFDSMIIDDREPVSGGSGYGRPDGKRPNKIHWVIVGGESGKDARPMHPNWARDIRDQCKAAGVPFYFKQWGEYLSGDCVDQKTVHRFQKRYAYGATQCKPDLIRYAPMNGDFVKAGSGLSFPPEYVTMYRVGKKKAGRLLGGVLHDGYPEVGHE